MYFKLRFVDPEPLAWAGARAVLVPFLLLGDGGFVALWYFAAKPAVIQCDSEGGHRVVASDFDDFLLRMKRARTGVADLDGSPAGRQPPPHGIELGTRRSARTLVDLAKQLRRVARKPVVRRVAQLVAASRFEPYRPRDDWSLSFRIVKHSGAWQLQTFEDAMRRCSRGASLEPP